MLKFFLLLLIFFSVVSSSFTISLRRDFISIRNNSSQTLVITAKYRDDPIRVFPEALFPTWIENINGLYFVISDFLRTRENIVEPNGSISIVRYEVGRHDWEIIDQTSSLNVIKSIFQSLRIVSEDGSNIITLENIGEQIIERRVWEDGRTFHTIIIFD